jgi:cell division protein FtsW
VTDRAPKRMAYDRWLFFTTLLLVVGGLFMVGSSSGFVAIDYGKSPSAFFFRHGVHALLGCVALYFAATKSYERLDRRRPLLLAFLCCLGALIAVLVLPDAAGGAKRWLVLGPVRVQPSEFTKLFVVVYLAHLLSRKEERIRDPWSVLVPASLVVGTLATLILVEPDLGSAALLLLVAALLLFAGGLEWKYVTGAAALAVVTLPLAIVAAPYRLERLLAWWRIWTDPGSDALGSNFQLNQSLLAFGNGGLAGLGLGQGLQKAFYVPASHTDFIFSVVGEELGLVGAAALLGAFLILFWRGLRAAVRAPNRFGFYLALGITCLLVVQALTNMAVCLGLLPTKGLPLPLISYGGSSLLVSMTAAGLLLNVSQHSN